MRIKRTSLYWATEKLSHVWVSLFLEELKIVTRRDRTRANSERVKYLTTKSIVLISNFDLLIIKNMLSNEDWSSQMNFFWRQGFFPWTLISKMGVKMNLRIITKNHAADSEIGPLTKLISEPYGRERREGP